MQISRDLSIIVLRKEIQLNWNFFSFLSKEKKNVLPFFFLLFLIIRLPNELRCNICRKEHVKNDFSCSAIYKRYESDCMCVLKRHINASKN